MHSVISRLGFHTSKSISETLYGQCSLQRIERNAFGRVYCSLHVIKSVHLLYVSLGRFQTRAIQFSIWSQHVHAVASTMQVSTAHSCSNRHAYHCISQCMVCQPTWHIIYITLEYGILSGPHTPQLHLVTWSSVKRGNVPLFYAFCCEMVSQCANGTNGRSMNSSLQCFTVMKIYVRWLQMQSEAVNVDICPTPHMSSMQTKGATCCKCNRRFGSAANCYNVKT